MSDDTTYTVNPEDGNEPQDSNNYDEYSKYYNEDAFWNKLKGIFKKTGRELLEVALKLYYATRDPDTPTWVKATAIGALGYLILPIDVIPDFIPVVGLTDDLAVLVGVLSAVAAHIKEEHIAQAQEQLNGWFGKN